MRAKLVLLLGFILAWVAWAQPSPTTLNFSQRERGTVPVPQDISITGSGTITIGSCTSVVDPGNMCGNGSLLTSLTSTTAPATLHVYWSGYGSNLQPAGSYRLTFPVTVGVASPVTITVNLTVIARTLPTITTFSGSFPGCSNTSSVYYADLDTCSPTAGYPGRGAYAPAAQGAIKDDPNFGGHIRTLVPLTGGSAARGMQSDSTISGINLDGTKTFTQTLSGHLYVTSTSTGADLWDLGTLGECTGPSWSSLVALKFYCYTDSTNSIYPVTLTTPGSVAGTNWTVGSNIYTWTGSGTAVGITTGGDGGLSKDEYECFFTHGGTARIMGIVNLQTGAAFTADYSGDAVFNTTCASGASPAPCGRACTISKGPDISTGYYYIAASIDNGRTDADWLQKYRWKPGDTVLTKEGFAAADPNSGKRSTPTFTGKHCSDTAWTSGNCMNTEHMDTVEIGGHQFLAMSTFLEGQPYIAQYAFIPLWVNPDDMWTPVELGGNLYYATIHIAQGAPISSTSSHTGCAKFSPTCIYETDSDPVLPTWQISAATVGPPVHITSAIAPGPSGKITNGDVLRFGGMQGMTNLNQSTCTVANVAGTIASASRRGGTIGNGVLTMDPTTPVLSGVQSGTYSLLVTAAGSHSATFAVSDANGTVVGTLSYSGAGATGSFATGIKFTITDGSVDFTVNPNNPEGFNVTVGNFTNDCVGLTGNGTYTGRGAFIQDAAPPANPHQGEIALIDATNMLTTKSVLVRRIAKSRSNSINGVDVSFYNGQAHPVLSPDGTLTVFESNYGNPELLGVFAASTGYVVPQLYPGSIFRGLINGILH